MVQLDILITLNFIFSFSLLLVALFTKRISKIAFFPRLLLVSTIFGLLVNFYTTQRILIKGTEFDGILIRYISDFTLVFGTTGLAIYFITFILLNAIHTLIVAKGNTRIAEVAARFTLDSLPGRLIAIDAELEAGAITEEKASLRVEELWLESDLLRTLDGMRKLIIWNVKIEIIITTINILVGILLGTLLRNEALNDAIETYTSLAIGSGVFYMLPTGMVAVAMGIIVTKEARGDMDGNKLP